jgi:small subunit ribosomal protein S11
MASPKKPKTVVKKSKIKKKLTAVKVYLKAGFNNSIITLTDMSGVVLAWSTSGREGFKGSRKSTPFASQKATETIIEKIKEVGATSVHILIKGAGMGRDPLVRTIQSSGISIETISDLTGFPFGGVRKKQQRKG